MGWRRCARSEIEVSCTMMLAQRLFDWLWHHRYFLDQPLLHPRTTDQHLLAWYFEDWLKKLFFTVLEILEVSSFFPGWKQDFGQLEHRTYCTIPCHTFGLKQSASCLPCCEINLNKSITCCDCSSINLYVSDFIHCPCAVQTNSIG